jgi:imidazolonepropionase-like amidohydrolase
MPAWHLHGLVLPDAVEQDVYVVDGRISLEPVEGAVTLGTGLVLIPGLADAHAHLSLASPAGDAAPAAERVRASARVHLDAGVLAVREPGSPDGESLGLGPAEGLPRVTTAGRFLAPPGRYFPGLAREVHDPDLVEAALEELAASGDWVKIIGDSPVPGPGVQRTFADSAVADAVRAVHAAGGRVAMHCGLPEVIQTGIDAGIDTLEHATFLQPDQVAGLAASGGTWVPTLIINAAIRTMLPPPLASLIDRLPDALQAAADAGVPILAGTDAGMGSHGQVRKEIELLAAAGLPQSDALAAGSWLTRDLLHLPGIATGAPADVVGFRADPRDDLAVLAEPAVALLDGQVVRRP